MNPSSGRHTFQLQFPKKNKTTLNRLLTKIVLGYLLLHAFVLCLENWPATAVIYYALYGHTCCSTHFFILIDIFLIKSTYLTCEQVLSMK